MMFISRLGLISRLGRLVLLPSSPVRAAVHCAETAADAMHWEQEMSLRTNIAAQH